MGVSYAITINDPHSHEFAVVLQCNNDVAKGIEFSLPAWIPGSYMIRDFARHITAIQALDGQGAQQPLRKVDKHTWQVAPGEGQVSLHYRVYAWDLSVRSAYLDQTRAYFNATSLLLRVVGQEATTHELHLPPPTFAAAKTWKVATTLPPQVVDKAGFGSYVADSYTQLIDHPVEMADYREIGFTVNGIPHRMVFSDAAHADLARIADDVTAICTEQVALFGELPVQQYLFMTLATADGYGGLEHADSTSLICRREDLPYPGVVNAGKGYQQFMALCSHEYFHLWNVKRIRPAALAQSQLTQEAYTELLWAFEGITSYYDELALPRAGVISTQAYLDMLASSVSRYLQGAGRHHQSVAESSFDAWTKFYRQDENAPNAIVSYYNKGGLLALGLDCYIRTTSKDQLTLDDFMRHLWQHFGRTGIGIAERGIEVALAQLLGQSADDFFTDYIYGTAELPLQEWFASLGVGLRLRAAQNEQDLGGYAIEPTTGNRSIDLGAKTSSQGGLVKVEIVYTNRPAQQAGIAPGDLLLAVDGERCTQNNLQALLARKVPGDTVEISLFRRDLLRHLPLVIQPAIQNTCELYLLEEPEITTPIMQRRDAWLSSVQQA